MKAIGITGQKGFVGSHLYNKLSLLKDEFSLVPFQKAYFDDKEQLTKWVAQCDVIVHLAAMNRHEDANVIFETNVSLVQKLVDAVKTAGTRPHILLSSSTQEERDNLYGKSKKIGRELLKDWAAENGGCVTGMVIPNVYGPFGKPFYNSVVATFCHQLCNGQMPAIDVDGFLKLIFVDELVTEIIKAIREEKNEPEYAVAHTVEVYVSKILAKLSMFKTTYLEQGIFPPIENDFERNLFNTFRSYIDHKTHFPVYLKKNTDNRGTFVETVKLNLGGQVSFSTTVPGITRGNHFHTRKIERFAVIKGKATIQLRKYNSDEVINFALDGNEPSYVDMPVWYTHNITNVGDEELYTIFWINEFFDPNDPDTYLETV